MGYLYLVIFLIVSGFLALAGRDHLSWKAYFRDIFECASIFAFTVLGLVLIYMVLNQAVGYIPYSDRPGPGWKINPHLPTWKEFLFFGDFATFSAIYFIPLGVILRVVFSALERVGLNRWLNATLAFLLYGLGAGYFLVALGWYIAIAAGPVYFGTVCSAVLGALFAFKFERRERSSKSWILRISGAAVVLYVCVIVYSLWALRSNSQQLQLTTFVREPGKFEVKESMWGQKLSSSQIEMLKGIQPTGKFKSIGSSADGLSGTKRSASAIVVFSEMPEKTVELDEPDGVSVIYVQQLNGLWEKIPKDAPVKDRKISYVPDLTKDEMQVQTRNGGGTSSGFIRPLKSLFIGSKNNGRQSR